MDGLACATTTTSIFIDEVEIPELLSQLSSEDELLISTTGLPLLTFSLGGHIAY